MSTLGRRSLPCGRCRELQNARPGTFSTHLRRAAAKLSKQLKRARQALRRLVRVARLGQGPKAAGRARTRAVKTPEEPTRTRACILLSGARHADTLCYG